MHPRTVKKILENDEELNIGEMAEAILEDKKHEPKRTHVPSMARSQQAYQRMKAREQEQIAWRNAVAKHWSKQKQA